MTKGEYRVGVNFNPSKDSIVDEIKWKTAALIDLLDTEIKTPALSSETELVQSNEINRLKALAMTAYEEAAMWAVKAATKGRPE